MDALDVKREPLLPEVSRRPPVNLGILPKYFTYLDLTLWEFSKQLAAILGRALPQEVFLIDYYVWYKTEILERRYPRNVVKQTAEQLKHLSTNTFYYFGHGNFLMSRALAAVRLLPNEICAEFQMQYMFYNPTVMQHFVELCRCVYTDLQIDADEVYSTRQSITRTNEHTHNQLSYFLQLTELPAMKQPLHNLVPANREVLWHDYYPAGTAEDWHDMPVYMYRWQCMACEVFRFEILLSQALQVPSSVRWPQFGQNAGNTERTWNQLRAYAGALVHLQFADLDAWVSIDVLEALYHTLTYMIEEFSRGDPLTWCTQHLPQKPELQVLLCHTAAMYRNWQRYRSRATAQKPVVLYRLQKQLESTAGFVLQSTKQ